MKTSGTTAIATAGVAAVTLIAANPGDSFNRVVVINEGVVAGLVSIDNGVTWARLPQSATGNYAGYLEIWEQTNTNILLKRPAGTDVTGVWAFASWVD